MPTAGEIVETGEPREVTSGRISDPVRYMLWGRAAGRCQRATCNQILWRSPISGDPVNIAEAAHIWSLGEHGPRGRGGLEGVELNDVENLLLLCSPCHKEVDTRIGDHPADVLREWKRTHEARIERSTELHDDRRTEVVVYGAPIGDQAVALSLAEVRVALVGRWYPRDRDPVQLGTVDSSLRDRNAAFWAAEAANLETKVRERLHPGLARGEVQHASVFAVAPQPLLVRLGTLIPEIHHVEVYQLHREPRGWRWPDGATPTEFRTVGPSNPSGPPALVVSVSACIEDARVEAALGQPSALWRVSLENPRLDAVKSPADLLAFRRVARDLLEQIAAAHGRATPISVFMAAPNSVAVELGRVRLEKAAPVWRLFDQPAADTGFVHSFDIHTNPN